MKAILYVGGALMVAASIYGFIDYKKSSHDQKFRNLYENKKEVSVEKGESNSAANVKQESSLSTKEEGVKTNSTTEIKKVGKKKRKVNLENYSRAPLDDKYLKKELKIKPKKIETKEL